VSVANLAQIFLEETGQQFEQPEDIDTTATIARVLRLAAEEAEDSVVIICGTGYIMPIARCFLGIQEPR
jgi:hypothetical protein